MKPLIVIVPQLNENPKPDKPFYEIQEAYSNSVIIAGGIPFIATFTNESDAEAVTAIADGFLLMGDHNDIHPRFYGDEMVSPTITVLAEKRPLFELPLIRKALKAKIPTFGICGGMQSINVALGGNLIQDIPSEFSTTINHSQSGVEKVHLVNIVSQSLLFDVVKSPQIIVNSSHHQAVKKVGGGLMVSATAEDGIVEGIELAGESAQEKPFLLGVQWHPERLVENDRAARALFDFFIDAAKKYHAKKTK